MASSRTEVSPEGVAPPAANYALAIHSEGISRTLHTSGIVPVRPDGSVPDDIGEQSAVVWETLLRLLAEADMGPLNIVAVTTYVVVGNELGPVMAARDVAIGGHRAASTLVTVPALARPAWKMEIAIVATA